MKKLIIVVAVLAAAMVFASCAEKGGTIEVTNEYKILGTATPVVVSILKGLDVLESETIPAGGTKSFTLDEDGIYIIAALPGTPNPGTASLLAGNTVTVTIK
jgi:hypothetical protein